MNALARPSREESEHIIRMLVDKYPQTFFQEPRQRRPLKKDIVIDLQDDGFAVAPGPLKKAVDWYQSHFGYHYSLQAGSPRIDLNGKAVAKVTSQEAMKAKDFIAERQRELSEISRNPIETVTSFNRVVTRSEDATRKVPAPEVNTKPNLADTGDPLLRLQEQLDAVRRVMTDTPNPTLRTAFAVAGLGVLAQEVEAIVKELQSARIQ
jgi:sRNA-binding protein